MAKPSEKPKKMVPLANVIVIAGILLAFAAAIPQGTIKHYLFNLSAPAADYPAPKDLAEAQWQDLDYLEHYPRGYDRSYGFRARGKALDLIREGKERAGQMSPAEFEILVSRVVALGENGHSNVWSGPRSRRHPMLPVHGYWFDDGYYILRAHQDYANLLGAKITHLGGRPIAEVYELLRPLYGGEDTGFKAYSLPFLLENTAILHELGILDDAENPTISVVLADGGETDVTLKALPPDPERIRVWPWHWLAPVKMRDEPGDWVRHFEDEAGQPFYLSNLTDLFQLTPLPEVKGLQVQFRTNDDFEDQGLDTFKTEIYDAIAEQNPEVLIIDERQNGGGDYTWTVDLMYALPERLPEDARIYVITGHETFSAAISSIGFLKDAAGGNITIVGRRIGDSPLSWGETNDFILPNSGIGITAARGLHDQINGCFDLLQCYWSNLDYPVAVGDLSPDIEVPFRFSDYLGKRDAALEAILGIERAN